ncbi:MAG: mechanosensitive ion channel family protein [Pseudomonadales bacterium]|nr:mechanosensitive ion channel family protein [Pseudomonadales bacterium]
MITVIMWHAADIVVERTLLMHAKNMEHERRARRLDTLVPLLRSIIQITIAILSALLILSELGINIGPLLAGAGILGLAVGFGAQTLVKDLITGVTILLEDAASLDDVIEVGNHMGKVEEMRIRVLQLRDLAGVVHVIPYSEVTSIKNYTKDFSYYLFDVGIAYREDVDEVMEVLKKLSDEICEDEEFKDLILEPLEILGVDQFADSAVVIKARIKTQPRERWAVGREFNRRMKKRFDEEGIEIPFPHRTVYVGEPKECMAPSMPLTFAEKEEKLLEKLVGKAAD